MKGLRAEELKTEVSPLSGRTKGEEPDGDFSSNQKRFFAQLAASEFPLVIVERLSHKDLKIYLGDVRNYYDLEKSLPQFKDGKEVSGEVSDAGEESLRNDKYSVNISVSEVENCTKYTTSSGNTRRFKCSFCSSVFKYPGHLDNHILTHGNTKLFECLDCSYKTKSKRYLNRHLKKHSIANKNSVLKEKRVKIYKCSECSYESKKRSRVCSHILTHTNIKLLKCPQCNYGSNHTKTLKRHILQHTGIKLYYCLECSYSCIEKHKLKRHMLVHFQFKSFKCSKYKCNYQCNIEQCFNFHLKKYKHSKPSNHIQTNSSNWSEYEPEINCNESLKIHMLKHKDTKLFRCSECCYESIQKRDFRIHLLNHRKNRLNTVDTRMP